MEGGERREMGVGGGEDEGMLALTGGTCCRRRRGDVGGRGAWEALGNGGLHGGAAGGGTKHR